MSGMVPEACFGLTRSHSKNHHRVVEFVESGCVNSQRTLSLRVESAVVKLALKR